MSTATIRPIVETIESPWDSNTNFEPVSVAEKSVAVAQRPGVPPASERRVANLSSVGDRAFPLLAGPVVPGVSAAAFFMAAISLWIAGVTSLVLLAFTSGTFLSLVAVSGYFAKRSATRG
ncbi:hypothetical protein Enr13x_04940 [Stieleria neptunia]|uniref:Uncharacterized protein n=1 Tax=Stieleria neptunia TaxID=2527979 RepID=A0A518HIP7_9BACT|nr:hypothetical protein Enr13x_04940 [Stieleria neptunia]